jgi:hypothetical protein
MNLAILAPSFDCAVKFLCFPAQPGFTLFFPFHVGKRSPDRFLCKSVNACAKQIPLLKTLHFNFPIQSGILKSPLYPPIAPLAPLAFVDLPNLAT